MELARVFAESGIEFDATLVFALWAGEEQGHYGSLAHVRKIAAEREKQFVTIAPPGQAHLSKLKEKLQK